MKQNIRACLLAIPIVLAYTYLFCFPKETSAAVADGLRLCSKVILPSLFPYFVLTNCVVSAGLMERAAARTSKYNDLSAFLLGLLGGYPLGAKALVDSVREGRISPQSAAALLPFCNNAGAALFLSMIGNKLFGSSIIGALLYGIHILSALIIRALVAPKTDVKLGNRNAVGSFRFTAAVQNAATTALTVCAFIVIFSVITRGISLICGSRSVTLLLSGVLELSGGCNAAASANCSLALRAALCSLFAGWGGFCVHAQTAAIFESAEFPAVRYIAVKALHGTAAFGLTFLIFSLLQI